MSKQDNLKTQEQFGEAVNSGNLQAMVNLVSPDCVDHDPAPGQVPGPQGYIAFFTEFRSAFPDLKIAVDHAVTDDDHVVLAYTASGTHQGTFLGIPATGRPFSARGLQIARFEGGKMVERWGSSDQLGILKQLGVEPKA